MLNINGYYIELTLIIKSLKVESLKVNLFHWIIHTLQLFNSLTPWTPGLLFSVYIKIFRFLLLLFLDVPMRKTGMHGHFLILILASTARILSPFPISGFRSSSTISGAVWTKTESLTRISAKTCSSTPCCPLAPLINL